MTYVFLSDCPSSAPAAPPSCPSLILLLALPSSSCSFLHLLLAHHSCSSLLFFLAPPSCSSSPINPSSSQSISNKWTEVKQLVPQRDQVLQAELMKQQNNERLRQAFAAKANTVGPWIERQSDAIASIPLQMQVRIWVYFCVFHTVVVVVVFH